MLSNGISAAGSQASQVSINGSASSRVAVFMTTTFCSSGAGSKKSKNSGMNYGDGRLLFAQIVATGLGGHCLQAQGFTVQSDGEAIALLDQGQEFERQSVRSSSRRRNAFW